MKEEVNISPPSKSRSNEGPLISKSERAFVGQLNFLDSLINIGEEPWEIEVYVHLCAEAGAKEFTSYLALRGLPLQSEGIREFLVHFFEYVYLERWGNRRSKLRNISKPALEEYLLPSLNATAHICDQSVLGCAQVLLLFFHFVSELGYPIDTERVGRALSKIEQEVHKRFTGRYERSEPIDATERKTEKGKPVRDNSEREASPSRGGRRRKQIRLDS